MTTIDIQHEARQFPKTLPLGSIEGLVVSALTIVEATRREAARLPSEAARIAQSALDKVAHGLNAVADQAHALVARGADPRMPAAPSLMNDLRQWAIQAAIESNAVAAGNDRLVEAQRQFFSDVAEQAQKVGTWILQAPAKAVNLALSPLTGPVKWLLIFAGVGFGLYLWTRWREQE
jgi:hypothetical protein